MVAVIAHALAVINRDIFGGGADPGAAAAAALFHDASEIFTGDLPTPIKYFDPNIMSAYKRVESVASAKLLSTLPAEMRPAYEALLSPGAPGASDAPGAPDAKNETNAPGAPGINAELIKAADKLAAYIKCLEELHAGNAEFRLAAQQSRKKLDALALPEVEYFIERFIPAFGLTLDEMDFTF